MENRKRGRPEKPIEPANFSKAVSEFRAGNVTADQAAAALGIARSTFFLKLKAHDQDN